MVVASELDIVLGLGFLLTVHNVDWDPRAGHHLANGVGADPQARTGPPPVGDRRRPHRRLLPVRRPDRRRHRRRPGRGHPQGDPGHGRAAVQAQARADPGPPRDQPGPRGLQPADEPRREADRPRRDHLLPRHLRPRHPPDRRARQLPRARVGDARYLPDPGQQQPVDHREAADRGDGHPRRDRGGRRDLRDERGDVRGRWWRGHRVLGDRRAHRRGGRGRSGRPAPDRLDLIEPVSSSGRCAPASRSTALARAASARATSRGVSEQDVGRRPDLVGHAVRTGHGHGQARRGRRRRVPRAGRRTRRRRCCRRRRPRPSPARSSASSASNASRLPPAVRGRRSTTRRPR